MVVWKEETAWKHSHVASLAEGFSKLTILPTSPVSTSFLLDSVFVFVCCHQLCENSVGFVS